jgi:hypothetical protein
MIALRTLGVNSASGISMTDAMSAPTPAGLAVASILRA